MKKIPVFLFSLTLVLFSCKEEKAQHKHTKTEDDKEQTREAAIKSDTIIVLQQKTGAEEENIYFPVVSKDTVHFEVSFTNATDESIIAIIHFKDNLTYNAQYQFLKLIFKKAAEDISFSGLTSISIKRLPSTGDLAIAVTRQLMQQNKNLEQQIRDYKNVSGLLMHTKLTSDFNNLLKPYQIRVSGYDVEKVFMVDKEYMFKETKLETRSRDIPDKILEALIWIKLQQEAEK